MQSITRLLEQKLKANRQKSQVVKAGQVEFLGFVSRRGKIRWSFKSFERFTKSSDEPDLGRLFTAPSA